MSESGNARFRNLRVGVVGVGGTGSPVAEILARMGVGSLVLVDPDCIDDPSNLRRVVGSTIDDLRTKTNKTDVVKRHITAMGLSTEIQSVAQDARARTAARLLLDTDVVISSTDTHGSRAFLNQIAVQYWLPVIDVGVRVGRTKAGAVSGMPTEVRVLLPDSACLWCRRVLDAERIRLENLPEHEQRQLEEEGYVQRLPGQPSLAALNYFAAGLAVLTAAHLYSSTSIPSDSFVIDGWEQFAQSTTLAIDPDCICKRWRGQGDLVPLSYLDRVGS